MMEEFSFRGGKRKRGKEKEDPQRVLPGKNTLPESEAPDKKRRKVGENCRRPKKQRGGQKSEKQQKFKKPETFYSRYTIGKKIGEGGYGSVFEGTRNSDGLQVAIKFVPNSVGRRYKIGPDGSRHVPVEVVLMQKMSEPPVDDSVVRLIEWFDEPCRYILIMEHPKPCRDLWNLICAYGGSLSEDMASDIMYQVLHAAIHCQKREILHRDIKPDNFLINMETAVVKLIDFGCGDWIRDDEYHSVIGTWLYHPPESILWRRYRATPATVWSLGVTLYRMVMGHMPFKSIQEIVQGRLEFRDDLSKECCDLIRWCLQVDPNSRPSLLKMRKHQWFKSTFPEQVMEKDEPSRTLA
ncbi:serine/threonine-protein kinase pim-1 [Astyanax mexicanus]|uniref:serine/threonine-protein kinase pim-1 n=1 Tax=Astyanax mexicanus TaxID=7994 RepID=UPI0020CB5170|nr:serine/threonine-protein kinase pim-1 [Astyanax mexicanus]